MKNKIGQVSGLLLIVSVLLLAFIPACGSTSSSGVPSDVPSGSMPVVTRVEPAAGAPGDTITVFGVGFSAAYPLNIVVIGGAAVTATSYTLLPSPAGDEVESITATVPAGANAGADTIVVMVHDNVSNADVAFTVN